MASDTVTVQKSKLSEIIAGFKKISEKLERLSQ